MGTRRSPRGARPRLIRAGIAALTAIGLVGIAAAAEAGEVPPRIVTTTRTTWDNHCPMTTMPPPCERYLTTTTITTTTTTAPVAPSPLCAYRRSVPVWLWRVVVQLLGLRCGPIAATVATRPPPG